MLMAAERSKREDEINRLFYLQSLYNQQYEALMGEITNLGVAQAALDRNMQLLNNKDSMKGANILVSGEGGTYFEASVKGINKLMTYVGAGYLVEMDVEKAKEFITENMETSRGTLEKLAGEKQKLENEIMRVQYAIESMQQQGQ